MSNAIVRYSYQDLLTTPEDGNRYEIFEGDLIVTPSPSYAHQNAVTNIVHILASHIKLHRLGKVLTAPLDVYLDEETVVEPDILFVERERLSIIDKQRVNGAPDLIIEVLSPSTEERDRGFKFKRYAHGGVQEYWIVDPEKRHIEIYVLSERGFTLAGAYQHNQLVQSKLLSGLQFPASEAWE